MTLHPRTRVTEQARRDFFFAFAAIIQRHELTGGEAVQILAGALHEQARYIVRGERHPDDPSKKGDEA